MMSDFGKELDSVSRYAYRTARSFIISFHSPGKGITEEDYCKLLDYIQGCIDRRMDEEEEE